MRGFKRFQKNYLKPLASQQSQRDEGFRCTLGAQNRKRPRFLNKNIPMNYTLLLLALLFAFAVLAEVEVRAKKR